MEIPIWASDFCIVDNEAWIIHGKINGLFKYDFKTQKLVFVGIASSEVIDKDYLFSSIKAYKKEIFLIPRNANNIYVFDRNTFESKKIEFGKKIGSFIKAFVNRGELFCIPFKKRDSIGFVKINLDNHRMEQDEDFWEKLPSEALYINDADLSENEIVGIIGDSCKFFVYNYNTGACDVVDTNENDIINTVFIKDGMAYLYGRHWDKVLIYDLKLKKFSNKINTLKKYARIYRCGEELFALDDSESNSVYIYDIKKGEMIKEYVSDTNRRFDKTLMNKWSSGTFSAYQNEKSYYFDRNSSEIVEIKKDKDTRFEIVLLKDEEGKWKKKLGRICDGLNNENLILDLDWFINSI